MNIILPTPLTIGYERKQAAVVEGNGDFRVLVVFVTLTLTVIGDFRVLVVFVNLTLTVIGDLRVLVVFVLIDIEVSIRVLFDQFRRDVHIVLRAVSSNALWTDDEFCSIGLQLWFGLEFGFGLDL